MYSKFERVGTKRAPNINSSLLPRIFGQMVENVLASKLARNALMHVTALTLWSYCKTMGVGIGMGMEVNTNMRTELKV